jgi:hypothetical protein
LVRVKTAVDPVNFFRHEQSIPSLSSWWYTGEKIITNSIMIYIEEHVSCIDLSLYCNIYGTLSVMMF